MSKEENKIVTVEVGSSYCLAQGTLKSLLNGGYAIIDVGGKEVLGKLVSKVDSIEVTE